MASIENCNHWCCH